MPRDIHGIIAMLVTLSLKIISSTKGRCAPKWTGVCSKAPTASSPLPVSASFST